MNQSTPSQNSFLLSFCKNNSVEKLNHNQTQALSLFTPKGIYGLVCKPKQVVINTVANILTIIFTVITAITIIYSISMNQVYADNYFSNNNSMNELGQQAIFNTTATKNYPLIKTKNTPIPIDTNYQIRQNSTSFNVSNYLNTLASNNDSPNYGLPTQDFSSHEASKEFDIRNLDVSQYKIATMHVLSDLCPKLLAKDQKVAFSTAFDAKFNKILPETTNPKDVFRDLYAQKDYRVILTKMQNNQHNFSATENKALCEDIARHKH